jgi:asparagine synthase (glutamine-hydrolysing)
VPTASTAALDDQAIYNYVYFHVIPSPRTVFRGVSRLEPASELRIDQHGVALRRTWQPQFASRRAASVTELQSHFRRCIRESVAEEASGAAVGCFLSGGTDSSTVAGMLKQVTGRAATFSMGFDQRGYDEMEYARIAARHFGTEHHEHYVTPAELVAAIPLVAAHYDQPFGNSSAVPAFICARLARSHGVEHILAGDGGDELFGGNSRYAKQKVFEVWWRLPGAARAALSPLLANDLIRALPVLRKTASYADQASVPMPARLETYNLLKRFGAASVLTPRFRDSIVEGEPASLQDSVYERQRGVHFVDRMLAYDWRFTLADNDLPKVTGTTALAGLTAGFPLLDDKLLEISTQITAHDKVRGLRLRHFFKEALTGFLPQEIINKKKHGFGLPVGAWLVGDSAFRALTRDSVAALASRGVIRAGLVDDLFSRRLEEHAGYYGEMAWILMMLEQWLSARAPAWKP